MLKKMCIQPACMNSDVITVPRLCRSHLGFDPRREQSPVLDEVIEAVTEAHLEQEHEDVEPDQADRHQRPVPRLRLVTEDQREHRLTIVPVSRPGSPRPTGFRSLSACSEPRRELPRGGLRLISWTGKRV